MLCTRANRIKMAEPDQAHWDSFNPSKFCKNDFELSEWIVLRKPSNDPGAQVASEMKLKRITNCVENWTLCRCGVAAMQVRTWNEHHAPSLITCLKLMNEHNENKSLFKLELLFFFSSSLFGWIAEHKNKSFATVNFICFKQCGYVKIWFFFRSAFDSILNTAHEKYQKFASKFRHRDDLSAFEKVGSLIANSMVFFFFLG